MAKTQIRWKRWMHVLFRRRVLVALSLLVQFFVFAFMYLTGIAAVRWLYFALTVLSVLAVMFIITRRKQDAYKLPWLMLIALMPAFGGLLFLIVHAQSLSGRIVRRLAEADALLAPYLQQDEGAAARYAAAKPAAGQRARYLSLRGFPIFDADDTVFFPSGEAAFAAMCAELRRAEHFIFLEYFIVAEGEMWDEIHAILREKAAAGVEVKLIYDDMGSFFRLPYRYDRDLTAEGIETILFNPFRPVISTIQNNRDHRKIMVVDGRVAFTGGINIGDEYINRVERCGHWNDVAMMVTGGAVRAFTAIFLEMWLANCRNPIPLARYFPPTPPRLPDAPARGFIQPYADMPLDGEAIGAWVYDHILRTASDYVWITTPYLIIDDALCTTLQLAAKSGVDVRIVLPGVPDKKLVYATTRTYFAPLIEAGVKIYTYTPGFLHAKVFLCDDRVATVGTINMDYRSLYLHFECGAWMTDTEAIPDIRRYFCGLFAASRQVKAEDLRTSPPRWLTDALLQLFAPFL
ncbi:MAG: cardiolipin synthase [Clostridia bacterium]|nr:cardiolipin synthase [Clostridia bacterium]